MNTPITAAADLRKKEILIAELREQILHLERERIVEFCDLKNENTTLRESCIELENKMAAAHNDARHLDSLRSENTSLLERIKELEIEKEGIQTAQAAMAEAMESTRKRMHRMQQIFGNLTLEYRKQLEVSEGLAAVVDMCLGHYLPEGHHPHREAAQAALDEYNAIFPHRTRANAGRQTGTRSNV